MIAKRRAERDETVEFAKEQYSKVSKDVREKIEAMDFDTLRGKNNDTSSKILTSFQRPFKTAQLPVSM